MIRAIIDQRGGNRWMVRVLVLVATISSRCEMRLRRGVGGDLLHSPEQRIENLLWKSNLLSS